MALLNFESFSGYTTSTTDRNVRAELLAKNEFDILNYALFAIVVDATFGKCLRLSPGGVSSTSYCRLSSSWRVNRTNFNWMVAISPSIGRMSIQDENGVYLELSHNTTSWSIVYNPAGTDNDINTSSRFISGGAQVLEFEWTPATFKLFINNVEVYQKVWTGVAAYPYGFYAYWSNGVPLIGHTAHSDGSRIGMLSFTVLPLGDASIDTGTVTGAVSPKLALGSFDGDTSYYTLANASSGKVLMALGDLPIVPDSIYGVKATMSSKKTDSGSITGSLLLSTGSENVISTTTDSLGYVTQRVVLTEDPHTSAVFTEATINGMEIGLREGV